MLENIIVFCDKPSDMKLFHYLKPLSPVLSQIGDENVRVLPNRSKLPSDCADGFGPLLEYDRADYYFCYHDVPFLVIEMTEHGYTGDMCMQRFARIAKAAEMKIPFISFAPLARTRYDELGGGAPSARRVSANMYRGFVRLTEIFSTPVVAVPWGVGENGIPLVLVRDDPARTGIAELFSLIDGLFSNHLSEMVSGKSILNAQEIQPYLEQTRRLSQRKNVRESEVQKEKLPFEAIENILCDPQNTYRLVPAGYFYRGKRAKLLAKACIDASVIRWAVLPSESVISIEAFLSKANEFFSDKPWFYYYSGYQWRSEPNIGIVTNLDFIKCRSKKGKTVYDRDQLLCVHWPRIFWDEASPVRQQLMGLLDTPQAPILQSRFRKAYCKKSTRGDTKVFGAWSDQTTVARVFRDVCDLVILNDAVIVGNKWRGCFEN